MPLPRSLARFNRRVTNRVAGKVAAWAPGFSIVEHRGRKSGRTYRTPINVFRRPGGYAVALTYGPGAEWVRNVLAAGEAILEKDGRRLRVANPRVVHDRRRRFVPPVVRAVLGLIGADAFLLLDEGERR
jgi:deazaflavin-dependent oxidoreductase (nitroreductase family)